MSFRIKTIGNVFTIDDISYPATYSHDPRHFANKIEAKYFACLLE